MKTEGIIRSVLMLLCLGVLSGVALAQTNEFTFQGKLNDAGMPSATYDFEFRLCSAATDCTKPLDAIQRLGVAVSNGSFTVKLDFNPAFFDGADRWLEIAVKHPDDAKFTTLDPPQKKSSAPYAIKSQSADMAATAANADQLGGLGTDRFVIFDTDGNVQIGGTQERPAGPGSKLTVAGIIESTAGGFKFPDATTQTTAGLTTVTTDGTLAGSGTPGSPLGVVSSPTDSTFQPFQASTGTHGAVLVTVPAGKRLVIEFVSASQLFPSSTQGSGQFQIRVGGSFSHLLPPLNVRTVGSNVIFSTALAVKIYVAAGQDLQVFFDGPPTVGSLNVSGYFVDVPAFSKAKPGKQERN